MRAALEILRELAREAWTIRDLSEHLAVGRSKPLERETRIHFVS